MRPRAGRPASIHKNFPPFPAHVRISSFSFLFLNKREKRSGWSCSCARAPAAAALWLLDRLMWTCHTGRAAVPYTKAAPRRRRHKNRNTQPIRERKVGNLLLQPPLYIGDHRSSIKSEMEKKGIIQQKVLPSCIWFLFECITVCCCCCCSQTKKNIERTEQSWEPLWGGFIIWPNQKNQLFFFFLSFFLSSCSCL